jgi:hypothetical protein
MEVEEVMPPSGQVEEPKSQAEVCEISTEAFGGGLRDLNSREQSFEEVQRRTVKEPLNESVERERYTNQEISRKPKDDHNNIQGGGFGQ